MSTKFKKAIAFIDQKNSEDPNTVIFEDTEFPKELLYSQRMTTKLLDIEANASEELQIAVRAQHICRWSIKRKSYSMDKIGYFQWRNDLKKMHSELTSEILNKVGYSDEFINRTSFLINKKLIKKDTETQTLEDVACLVFLQYYLEDFIAKHTDEKIIDILQKTWGKMSTKGQELALKTNLSSNSLNLLTKALE
ncbi:DUF4202 domain-containing protein [uncultured Winogradskyella sp.]|uniref:DUF4202 domain-containing protein n=1 Tax=uncultured Winogradskyella sp. TaxID=395353 RepID=UPI0026306321|nr:DUF4202 domain-containing protein [uncultured Winogradskyella sp.]